MSYKPADQVISFVSDYPRLAWIAKGYQFGHMITCDDHTLVAVSHDQEECQENLFSWVRIEKIKPYSDELWAVCQDWLERRDQLAEDWEKLKKQKKVAPVVKKAIPEQPQQIGLF